MPDATLSYLLCHYKNRVKRIKRNIREGHIKYKITLDELHEWEENLHLMLNNEFKSHISPLFKKYKDLNSDLPISRRSGRKVLNYHPNLKVNLFKDIDTKEKAYWLGFFWAEAYLGKNYVVALDLSKKDEILIDRVIISLGLNSEYKKIWRRKKRSGNRVYVRIRFKCKNIWQDLIYLGYQHSKLKTTKFPQLKNRELDLAFLLGFFDGDGKQGTNTLHIASLPILTDVKRKFKIRHEIIPDKDGYYYLSLGARIFNEMLNNFADSLPRKRKYFRVSSREIFENSLTKEELENLVWKYPIKEISKKFNTYPRIVRETCIKWGIKRPEPHFWHKKR